MNIDQILADAEQAIKDAREKLAKSEAEAAEIPSDLDTRNQLKETVIGTITDASAILTSICDGICETNAGALDVGDWESVLCTAELLYSYISSADAKIADTIEFAICPQED